MQPIRRNVFAIAAVALLSSTVVGLAQPAADYPTKPIKLILPAAAGGPTDVPARLASQILQSRLGQPVVIENRPGAGGALGARVVATAAPDGYMLLVANTSVLAVIPAVSASAGYDPVKNFTPIVRMTESFQILVVNAESQWKTLKEFVDYCRANPGKINYAHTGAGGLPHLVGELFMLRSGCKMTGVPYRSGGESVTAVLAKAVDTTIEAISITRSLILDGKFRCDEPGPCHRRNAEDHHRPRQRIEAEHAGGIRHLYRRAKQDLDRGRQSRRREDRLTSAVIPGHAPTGPAKGRPDDRLRA
jgi:tripartite-type tricarboxylate transporter receptor subunit TctC